MGLRSRSEGNPSSGVNLKQIRVEGPVSVVPHPSMGVNSTQFTVIALARHQLFS